MNGAEGHVSKVCADPFQSQLPIIDDKNVLFQVQRRENLYKLQSCFLANKGRTESISLSTSQLLKLKIILVPL